MIAAAPRRRCGLQAWIDSSFVIIRRGFIEGVSRGTTLARSCLITTRWCTGHWLQTPPL
jgi:hypothetical protein